MKSGKDTGTGRAVIMGQRMWQQAERDLESARLMLQPRSNYVAANLAQQAAEKALKAAHWHLLGKEPPWSHDLASLAEQFTAQVEQIPRGVHAAIALLDPLFERTRYPSGRAEEPIPADLVGEEDARTAIQSAEEVMAWVRTLLQDQPGKARHKQNC